MESERAAPRMVEGRSGEPVADAAEVAAQLGVQVLLFNCSQPEVIGDAVDVAQSVISRLGQAGGQGQGGGGEKSGQGFHRVCPFRVSCLSGIRLTSAT